MRLVSSFRFGAITPFALVSESFFGSLWAPAARGEPGSAKFGNNFHHHQQSFSRARPRSAMLRLALAVPSRLSRAPSSVLRIALCRRYGDYHCVEDMMTASEAWHSLEPDRKLDDAEALRRTFVKLDLDGNGKIDRNEVRITHSHVS